MGSKADFIAPTLRHDARNLINNLDDDEFKEWQNGVKEGVDKHDWARLASHPILRKPPGLSPQAFLRGDRKWVEKLLTTAYNKPFVGDTAKQLVWYLKFLDRELITYEEVAYAKTFSVVQSSGTGKSRMLTEAGKHIFTLPICLRGEGNPGFPPADLEVVNYFGSFRENDLSYSAHVAVACFIAAAHMTMHKWLKDAQEQNVGDLHAYWHERMEPVGERGDRNRFFSEVIKLADSLKTKHQNTGKGPNPKRKKTVEDDQVSEDINAFASKTYKDITEKATNDLMIFLSNIQPGALCVTYFDEAHWLKSAYWVLLRLLLYQDVLIRMWYIFMGTKSSLFYYAPRPSEMLSLKWKREIARLLLPYVALGFDQHVISKGRTPHTVTMGELQSIKHLSQYGRPLWNANLSESEDREIIELAALKLTNGEPISASNKHQVFAVLSQRLCLDPALSGSEAVELADLSVAHHMRLLTGFSDNGALFYTHSPSEPILALGSGRIMYNIGVPDYLRDSLLTLSKDLCSAGLVEKGTMGELAARALLLVARDFTVPKHGGGRDLLKPVRLLDFLDTLFGNKQWAGSNRSQFDRAFADAYVNFTHWVVTKDPMPVEPDSKLLANLWARGAALQCCFRQKAIDFTIPVYRGSINANAVFDPSGLSGISGQVKLRVSGEPQAESRIHPFGIPRDLHNPLPYLALLMELGTESNYEGYGKIKPTPSGFTADGKFSELSTALATAMQQHALRMQQVGKNKKEDAELKKLKKAVGDAQLAVDSYNRYSISVRDASPEVYGILKTANIADRFATLLKITMPLPGNQASLQHMRPLERLGDGSNHTAWMSEYVAPDDGDILMSPIVM